MVKILDHIGKVNKIFGKVNCILGVEKQIVFNCVILPPSNYSRPITKSKNSIYIRPISVFCRRGAPSDASFDH